MNPLNWLPCFDEIKEIPGDILWCDMWEINYNGDADVSGEITFKFRCRAKEYQEAMRKPENLGEREIKLLKGVNIL